jgi:integrase
MEMYVRLGYYLIYGALKKVAPRRVRFHALRHTYATLRVAKGDNIVDISNQLGHHDPGFTLKAYAHWLPGEHKSQVDELDDLAPKRTLRLQTRVVEANTKISYIARTAGFPFLRAHYYRS